MRPVMIATLTAAAMALAFTAGIVLPLVQPPGSTFGPTSAACRTPARVMTRLELLFGSAKPDGTTINDAEWQAFLDETVTPRFPDGLTVLRGAGQWRNRHGSIIKEEARVLLVWQVASTTIEADIAAIRNAYLQKFGQESVMRVDSTSCVSF